MPGTGDVIYVLGPSLVALGFALVVLVVTRALRRGPTVAARSAPDHGVQPPAQAPDGDDLDQLRLIPTQRRAEVRGTVTHAADGRYVVVRRAGAKPTRSVTRRVLSRH